MVRGIGTDIVEIVRIAESIERHGEHFLSRQFTPLELEYCRKFQDMAPHVAGRWAAKESVAKALGTGFGEHLAWHDFEVLNDAAGKPEVKFSATAKHHFKDPKVLVSISHGKDAAIAMAVWI